MTTNSFYHSIPELNITGQIPLSAQEYKFKHLHLPDLNNKLVLDIGSRSGWYSLQCAKLGAKVHAIDIILESKDHIDLLNTLGYAIDFTLTNFLDWTGHYDIVLFLGVLYHMKHPLLGLEKCFDLTEDLCVIESHVDDNDKNGNQSYMRFIPDDSLNNDPSNWWAPSKQCIIDMCKTVGFSTVECIHYHHRRAIFHAKK